MTKLVPAWKLAEAWRHHNEVLKLTHTNGRAAFMKFLKGSPPLPLHLASCDFFPHDCWEISEAAYDQVEAIRNSPHWHTLIKMHYAQKE